VAVVAFAFVKMARSAEQSAVAQSQPAASGPDLSGVWTQHPPANARAYALYSLGKDVAPMTPWAEARFNANKPSFGPRAVEDSNDPVNPTSGNVGCDPPGVPRIYLHPFPMEVIQIPGRVIMLFEFDHFVRRIYTDGRPHDKDAGPLWMGDSIGRWEGDTLVADSVSFNDKTTLDREGYPHSDALHLVERIRRADHDSLVVDLTVDDPKAYTKPWGAKLIFQLRPDWKIMEHVCEDNASFVDFNKKATQAPKK